jgi:hypothetical protein
MPGAPQGGIRKKSESFLHLSGVAPILQVQHFEIARCSDVR